MILVAGNEGVEDLTNLWGVILSFLADDNYQDILFTCRSINQGFKQFIDGNGVMFTWRIAAQKKYGSLLSAKYVLDKVSSPEEYLSLPSLRDYSIWIIKRAMYRYKVASKYLRHPDLTWYTPQLVNERVDPCIICGFRWSEIYWQRCEDETCPFQHLILPFMRVSRLTRGKLVQDTRLFVCKACGDKEPNKTMRQIQLHPAYTTVKTTLCFMCVKRNARIVRNS